MARIYDNIDSKFENGLKELITEPGIKRVDFCVGYFNLRGWDLVSAQIDTLEGDIVEENYERPHRCCRLLIGMQRPDKELVRLLYTDSEMIDAATAQRCKQQVALDFKRQLLLGLPTKRDENTLRRLSAQLKAEKVCVKLYTAEPLHAKLYLAHNPDSSRTKIMGILGSSNLTYSGLTRQGELDADIENNRDLEALDRWFNERWNDRFCIDITKEMIDAIDNSWAGDRDLPPYYIYMKTVYHLSADARNGMREFDLPIEFKRELFDFQQTAVKIAAHHLNSEKRGGAMIGDVVGLGKTITACAIAKIYELNYASSTLIVCPANLQEMWDKYRRRYDLKADIMSMARPIDVDNARYYRLVIVDESHNLRNSDGKRYRNIKRLIERQDCKVLLLTATPYNKDFRDLSAQLRLFIGDDQDLGIRPEEYIRELGGEHDFQQKHSEVFMRSIKAFEKSDSIDDWQELMKLFLIRRTRSFIKANYAKTDAATGRKYLQFHDGRKNYFPDRLPRAVTFDTVPGDQYSRLYSDQMIEMMKELVLPRYGLSQYADTAKIATASRPDRQMLDNLSRAGKQMMGFCLSTFFKRIDSSGFAFLLTLYRHILRNAVFIYAINNDLPLPIGDENALPEEWLDDEDINDIFTDDADNATGDNLIDIPTDMAVYMEKAQEYYNLLSERNNVAWLESSFFKRSLKTALTKDCRKLIAMIELCGKWQPGTDSKLNKLEELIREKHGTDKVVIFSQYSDTARYLYRQLRSRGITRIDCVTGSSSDPMRKVERFSPKSNGAGVGPDDELRVLVATDVLSEGQNLQDSHVIVNYDLPWAIIRLIQRAGRVDRIGQEAAQIFCYSFFPADGVEKIIALRKRLNDRINANAGVVGSDEVFFEGNEQNLRDMYNERSGALDDDDDDDDDSNDVDLASQAYQIWKNATDADPSLESAITSLSDIVYSTKRASGLMEDGVITYAKTHNDFDVLTWYNTRGEVVSQSQRRILQALACSAAEPAVPALDNHFDLVRAAVEAIKEATTTSASGVLGNRFSTRYRLSEFLRSYAEQPPSLFFDNAKRQELELAINDIYNYQLLEGAKLMLGRMLRNGTGRDDIVETVLEMRRNGTLCRITLDTNSSKDPSIICSMGLRYDN